ncbi:MAG: prepilin-type N-terminal cleavage/methylation domain-containing protein [Candidatus Ratteibacteria bacterium]|nr:prepilin-type N-terminal cleavage/methylation domain-containing protein [Candidatus Ratteibacteria bacterium]
MGFKSGKIKKLWTVDCLFRVQSRDGLLVPACARKGVRVWTKRGFTLIELMIVVGVIGFILALGIPNYMKATKKARDAKRINDLQQIQLALEMYYDDNHHYPVNTDNDCYGWDAGYDNSDPFIQPLEDGGYMTKVPTDPISKPGNSCWGYRYHRYGAGSDGCDSDRGAFYVLGVNLEASDGPHPASPGWSCPDRDWQDEREWVTGAFEH